MTLSQGLRRGQTLTVRGVATEPFYVRALSCEAIHYFIVGVLLACPQQPSVEMTLHNNYKAIPLAMRCTG